MEVLYIMGQSSGGLPHYTAELANAVSKRAEVTVMKPLESSADGLFTDDVDVRELFKPLGISMSKFSNLDINPIEIGRGILSYNQLKEIRTIDPQIVHDTTGFFPQVKLFSRIHNIGRDYPFVVTYHEVSKRRFNLSRPLEFASELTRAVIPTVPIDHFVVHTKNQREALINAGTAPRNAEVIPHGAYSVFGEDGDFEVPIKENSLLFFGNIVAEKGIKTLIEAIPLVKREIPDVTLQIAGEGQIPPETNSTIEAHEENFEIYNHFIPNEQVGELFAQSEVVVLPYHEREGTKGHSGTLSTAFSFGKPIIASTAAEFPEQVGEENCGLIVPPKDPERLAAAIVAVLSDEDARERMAENSHRMANRLSWDNIAKRYLRVYEDVVRSARYKSKV